MDITIACDREELARAIGLALEADGLGPFKIELGSTAVPEIRFSVDGSREAAVRVARVLDPIRFSLVAVPDLRPDAITVHLGACEPFGHLNLKILCEDEQLAQHVVADLDLCGGRAEQVGTRVFAENSMTVGGASPFCCQVIRWFLGLRGISVVEQKEWSDADMDVFLHLCDPRQAALPLARRHEVDVASDDPDVRSKLTESLVKNGFVVGNIIHLSEAQAQQRGNCVDPGVFCCFNDDTIVARLFGVAEVVARDSGVDLERHPVQLTGTGGSDGPGEFEQMMAAPDGGGRPRITLPVRACGNPGKPPTGGASLERWLVVVCSEEPAAAAITIEELGRAGFSRITHQPLLKQQRRSGFQITVPRPGQNRSTVTAVSRAMRGVLLHLGAGAALAPVITKAPDATADTLYLQVPSRGLNDGSLLAEINGPGRYNVVIRRHDKSGVPEAFLSALKDAGFENVRVVDRRSLELTEIIYGSASKTVVETVQTLVSHHLGITIAANPNFDAEDDDIFIDLAEGAIRTECVPVAPAPGGDAVSVQEADGWDRPWADLASEGVARAEMAETPVETRPAEFTTVTEAYVTVGKLAMPRRATGPDPRVPPSEKFDHISVDGPTADTLTHVAACVALGEPCLLEGGTSAGKTSIILYLASLLRQPTLRINLSGQTDVADLVGRHAPAAGGVGWFWQDGPLVEAMRTGAWLVLDELNLAEPHVLERLNPVMEVPPSLVLNEHDNRLIGGGEHPVHPDFRLFATMNPAEYHGRAALSPAWLDRWRGYRYVPDPGEAEYAAMLRRLVFDRLPTFSIGKRSFRSTAGRPVFGELAALPDMARRLTALARLHASVEQAARGHGSLGAERRDRYTFTRRALLSVLGYLRTALATGLASDADEAWHGALQRTYLQRVATGADRTVILRLIEAAGFGSFNG